jgi:hypothetical protein
MPLSQRLREEYQAWVIPCLAIQLGLPKESSLEDIKQLSPTTDNELDPKSNHKGTGKPEPSS